MKIYLSHSRKFDFKRELYKPIRRSKLNRKHEIILPHEHSDEWFPSQQELQNCDLMIAEASFESQSLSTELQWAVSFGVPIILAVKEGKEPSAIAKPVAKKTIVYANEKELIRKLQAELL